MQPHIVQRNILNTLRSSSNLKYAYGEIIINCSELPRKSIEKFLQDLPRQMEQFIAHVDLFDSDPLIVDPRCSKNTVAQEVAYLNKLFIADRVNFILKHTKSGASLHAGPGMGYTGPVDYIDTQITDGFATSRDNYRDKGANELLSAWYNKPAKLINMRDDLGMEGASPHANVNYRGETVSGVNFNNAYNENWGQSEDMFYTSSMLALNDKRGDGEDAASCGNPGTVSSGQWWGGGFGYNYMAPKGSYADDTRMLAHRTMRSWPDRGAPGSGQGDARRCGSEGQIPKYATWLHNRHYERDTEETLGTKQFDCQIRGWDMSDIHQRVDNSRRYKYFR